MVVILLQGCNTRIKGNLNIKVSQVKIAAQIRPRALAARTDKNGDRPLMQELLAILLFNLFDEIKNCRSKFLNRLVVR